MTFQEALEVIYADPGTYDRGTILEAIGAIDFFRENVLELEDYETDQLFQVLRLINVEGLRP